jgi:integrase
MKPTAPRSSSRNNNKPSWPPIIARQYSSGKTSWMIDVMVDGKRVRETYDRREDAELKAQQMRALYQREGAAGFNVPADVRIEAAKCIKLLEPYKASLTDAVSHYVDRVLKFRQAPTVSDAIRRLVDAKRKIERRPRTIIDLESRLGKFATIFGDKHLSDITVDEVVMWLDQFENVVTWDNYRRQLYQLWRYAVQHKWTPENVIDVIDRPHLPEPTRGIFTVAEIASLLEHAEDYDLIPYVVLGVFQGIRPEEIHKLDWKHINWSERLITLDGSVTKTTWRRVIEIHEPTIAWLSPSVKKGGPVVNPINFRKRFEALRKKAKLSVWPNDGLRHSFASYRYVTTKDLTAIAAEMGNSVAVLHRHYRALTTAAEAASFWALRPAEASNVVPISAAS